MQLGASEESFRLLVESVKDYGIFLLAPTGVILSWNAGAERIKQYRADEVIGRHFEMFYTAESRARKHPQHELEIARAEGRYEEEGWRVRKDGTEFWANVVITHLVDPEGNTLGFAKVTRDLTDRRRAEQALRDSELRARLVYESVKDYAILTLTPEGLVASWNEGARRIKGYEASEIIGRHFSTFYTEEDNAAGKWEYELREAALTGRFEDEGWRVRKDGTRFWANVVVTALYAPDRKLTGFSKVTRDVTERKRAEDRLRMANETLEKRVQQRTDELSRANEELQDAVRVRDEFLSIASHELRTPITPLKLQLQGLLGHLARGTLTTLPPERLERMGISIDRSINRLGNLIDSLLDVARINAGKIELHPEEVGVADLLNELCSQYQAEAKLAGSELRMGGAPESSVWIDRLRLEQVLSNLLTNAIKYGNGKPIAVSAELEDHSLVLTVEDQGIGISKDDRGRIFKRFEQVDRFGRGSAGLGLGLYITKQIVDALGGTIEVVGEPGLGSRFTVVIPLGQR